METNGKIVKVLTQAGAVGLALALIGLVWFVVNSQNTIVGNHINHNTAALIQLEGSIRAGNVIQTEQVQVLRELKDVIRFTK